LAPACGKIAAMKSKLLAVLFLSPIVFLAQNAERFVDVASRMQAFVDRGEVAGVVTLVANKDRVLHLGAVGKSDLAKERRLRADDIFWIASMSKPITGVAVAILADEGKLSFDDPLEKFLPEFAGVTVAHRPTLRDVLTHTSGLGEMTTRDSHLTLAETGKKLALLPLRFPPGTRWSYSTAGIDALGRAVEVASGVAFDVFLQKRLFDPLGMKDTAFWVVPEKEPRWAHSYRWNAQSSRLEATTIPYLYGTAIGDRQRPPLGGAGLFSTAEDIARFYQMMLGGGEFHGKRILKASTVGEMTHKQTGTLTTRPGMPWGLGFCIVEDPSALAGNHALSPGSFGHGGAFSTQSWADPVKGLIWVLMYQRDGKGNPDNSDVRIAFHEAAK
jgi:CubicO group peptidase (beta-lactamase class C family)